MVVKELVMAEGVIEMRYLMGAAVKRSERAFLGSKEVDIRIRDNAAVLSPACSYCRVSCRMIRWQGAKVGFIQEVS